MSDVVKRVHKVTRMGGSWGKGTWKKRGSQKRLNAARIARMMRKPHYIAGGVSVAHRPGLKKTTTTVPYKPPKGYNHKRFRAWLQGKSRRP